ncbi:MAG: nucleoside hydrolase [Anaerolineae bacterium]|nr:nucleoside hydrolase [Anaerolineae bacterium]
MEKRKVVIDCDTGVDDAMALILGMRSPAFDVLGITTTAGNVTLEKVVRNTLVVVEHAQREVPVYPGASRPLMGAWDTAENAHGSDGLGDVGFPDPERTAETTHAVDFLIETFMNSGEPVHLITLGPLTNVALALAKAPALEHHIASLVMMAGGINGGNVTAAAEFNVIVDPEAADIVFRSAIPKTMVGLGPIMQGGSIKAEDVAQFEQAGTPWCDMVGRLLRQRMEAWQAIVGEVRPTMPPDLAAMGVALDPDIAQATPYHVMIELNGTHTRGMTLADRRWYRKLFDDAPAPNVNVVTEIDNDRYRKLVLDTLLVQ